MKWWCNRGVERSANPNIERMLNVFDLHLSTPEEKTVSRICASKTSARNYRPCFRENQPKRSFSIKWKRAFWACFRENWVYKFGHRRNFQTFGWCLQFNSIQFVVVSVYTVYCTLYSRIQLANFMFFLYIAQRVLGFFSSRPNWDSLNCRRVCSPSFDLGGGWGGTHTLASEGVTFSELMWPRKVTAGECVPPIFGSGGEAHLLAGEGVRVKTISIKWLWPVKVTLKVIMRRLKVFC